MRVPRKTTIAILLAWLSLAHSALFATANAQLAGTITLEANPSVDTPGPDGFTYSNEAFACDFVQVKGEVLVAYTSESGAMSINTMPVTDGENVVRYPVMSTIKVLGGEFRIVLPAVLKAKIIIKTGDIVHYGGYVIEATRTIKAGDSISVLVVGGTSVLSVEAGEGAKPWFTAFKEGAKLNNDRAAAFEAWRIEKDYAKAQNRGR